MPLSAIVTAQFIQPLLCIAKKARSVSVIACLNHSTMYPAFFKHATNDPSVYYVFVVPKQTRKQFQTACGGLEVKEDNVMVVCSSYLNIDPAPRCVCDCKVSEGLFNLRSSSSGQGLTATARIPRRESISQIAEDVCQLDDCIIGVVAAVVSRQGTRIDIYSTDGRCFSPHDRLAHNSVSSQHGCAD